MALNLLGSTDYAKASDYNVLSAKGEKIFSISCDELSYLGRGIYEVSNAHKHVKFLNKNGSEIPLELPPDCKFHGIQTFGAEPTKPVEKLPNDALIELSKIGLYGLVRGDGTEILPFAYDRIRTLSPETKIIGKFNRKSDLSEDFLFDTSTYTTSKFPLNLAFRYMFESEGLIGIEHRENIRPLQGPRCGYINKENKIVIPLIYETITPFRDGLAVVVRPDTGRKFEMIDSKGTDICPELSTQSIFFDNIAIAAPDATPQLLGLVDKHFHFVVAPVYATIIALGENLFGVKKKENDAFDVINAEGKKLFTLPKNVSKFDDRGYESPALIIVKMDVTKNKSDAEKDSQTRIFDRKGKFLLDFSGWVQDCKNGVAILCKSEHTNAYCGVIDKKGNWLISIRDSTFDINPTDRIIEKTHINRFDSVAFKEGHYDQFAKFLADYNFIGMHRQKVESLLGVKPAGTDSVFYSMMDSRCGLSWRHMEIEYAKDKVKRWRFSSSERAGEYVETNKIFDPAMPVDQYTFIPKPDR